MVDFISRWISGLVREKFRIRISNFGSKRSGDAVSSLIDLLELASEITCGARDDGDPQRCTIPYFARVQLRNGEIEGVA